MTVKITIIGLGQIGASIGLALADHKDQVTTVGHDLSHSVERLAVKLGAVEKIEHNLPSAVRGADVVVLALPSDQVYATLKYIAEDLREQVVLLDTAPIKASAAAWVKEILPPGRHYLGLTPALNPAVLENPGKGIDAARADLFQKGLVGVTAPPDTPEGAVQLAASFVTLLGGRPYFADPAETDGLTTAALLLPEFTAAALAEAVTGQPGWNDIRKLAGRAFTTGTRPLEMETPAALAEAAVQNRASAVRLLDDTLAALTGLRDEIAGGDKMKLEARLERIQAERLHWLRERFEGDWLAAELKGLEMPRMGDILRQQVGGLGKLFSRGNRKPDDD